MAGLGGRDMWKKYPRQMLRSRVVSEGIRTVCPMATSGMYVPEEIRDFKDEKVITPSSDVEQQLTSAEMQHVADVAVKMKAYDNVGDAVYEMENAGLNAEQQIYLWTHFDSKQRSAMRKEQARLRAASVKIAAPQDQQTATPANEAKSAPAVAAPDTITPAAHKRLEARITELGANRDEVKAYVKKTFGKDHFPELTKDEYEQLDEILNKKERKLHAVASEPQEDV
jgi:hypothetical protein